MLPYARAALAAVAGARLAVEELTGLLRGRVAVGTVTAHGVDLPGPARRLPPRPSRRWRSRSPRRTPTSCWTTCATGRLDAAIVSIGEDDPARGGDPGRQGAADRRGGRAGHELAVHEVVPLAALRGHALICLPPGTGAAGPPRRGVRGLRVRAAHRVRGRRSGHARPARRPRARRRRSLPRVIAEAHAGRAARRPDRPARAARAPRVRLARVRPGEPGRPRADRPRPAPPCSSAPTGCWAKTPATSP